MKIRWLFFLIMIFRLFVGAQINNSDIGVILPGYFLDRDSWMNAANHSWHLRKYITIINPNSGPLPYSPYYDSYAALMKSHNAIVVGYVHTSYGSRPIADVIEEVRQYFALYEVDGIFLDEVADNYTYYSMLLSAIRLEFPQAYVVGNPGTDVSDVIELFNLTVVFEGSCENYLSTPLRNYNSSVAVLCYDLNISRRSEVLNKSLSEGVSFLYMTSDGMPNPWDSYDKESVEFIISVFPYKRQHSDFTTYEGVIYKNKKPLLLLGINWFGFETENYVVHGLWQRNFKDMLKQIRSLGFNAVRLPFCTLAISPGQMPSAIDFNKNPELKNDSSLVIMHKVIDESRKLGLYILLDYHRIGCQYIEELWYNDTFSEENFSHTWEWVAENFKVYPNVIGADVKNEPHGVARWGSGNLSVDWDKAAQRIAHRILTIAPGWLIFVEGTQFSNDVDDSEAFYGYNNFWGENLQAVDRFPLDSIPKDKLVLSPHVYGPDVYVQPYFEYENGFPYILRDVWEAHWGYLVGDYTLAIGEFGGKYGEGDPRDVIWQRVFVDYLKEKNICNVFYWSWNPNSGDTGGILDDDWYSVKWAKYYNLKRLFDYCREKYCNLLGRKCYFLFIKSFF